MILWDRIRENPKLLLRTLGDPALIGLGCNRMYYEYTRNHQYNAQGTDVFEDEDWDNLILLDACRADIYAEMTPFGGTPEVRESRGSASKQFVRGNFQDKTLHDVVYISGNRWYLQLQDELNCELHAYHDVERDVADGFVPSPEAVTRAVLELKDEYPNKRLLVHYMQPHYPYLNATNGAFELDKTGLRETVRASDVDYADVREAYRENLRYVLEHVQTLVEELDGKTVISSDHGEMLGDRLTPFPVRWVGHPPGIFTDKLTTVPWHVVSNGPRRKITAEPPVENADEVDMAEVEQNLKDLGYKV
ncbi:hypothetical protein SAMN04487947_3991 [Halogeometricum rufum]|uniref:Sulfatase n=1 Tax=Halogeometricum rufum TaxID=553469 RepID=A0A1I6J3E2_9EURY|nr:hypothetical protein [Halogeometricum rufum]SFR73468.1 hypothetical protein SAMN04487947_3991 [Halogeometricum rufum]